MEIDAQALTTCGVADDGDAISLGLSTRLEIPRPSASR
jgi:hypothetical protein